MPLIQWDSSYSVKVSRCDNDHQKLISLINSLHDAMKQGKGSAVIQGIAKELADYTNFHFSAEEALLERTKYPALEEHRGQHRAFIQRVSEIRRELESGGKVNTSATLSFLQDWLLNHIKQTDKKYSAHLNAHGVS